MARVVCLANSYKHGERCIAGKLLETGAWVRPVSDVGHGEIPWKARLIVGREPELLDVLDGVKECNQVVTIATTNYAEALDDALIQRPSRFDRVITMRPPDKDLRREIVHNLSRRIPLDQAVQDHVVCMTEGCTPAQVQEVIYGLVIQHKSLYDKKKGYKFTAEEVDSVLRRINRRNNEPIGFKKADIYADGRDKGTLYPH